MSSISCHHADLLKRSLIPLLRPRDSGGALQAQARLTERLLEDKSMRASSAVEALLFARLAPVLVLRVLPRSRFTVLTAALQLHVSAWLAAV